MGDLSSLKKKMRRLGAPYKHSTAYKIYGDLPQESPKRSIFWETHVGYIERYEHARFQSSDSVGVGTH